MAEWQLVISLQDDFNRKTTRSFDIEAADYPAALIVASNFVDDYVPITNLRVLKYTVGQEIPYAGVTVAGANTDAGLTVSWELTPLIGKLATTKVPGPPLNLFDTDGKLLISDARMVAFAAHFLAGNVYVSDGETVGLLKSGKLDK